MLLSGGGVVCRGNDYYGQLGIGGTTSFDYHDKNLKTVDLGTGSFETTKSVVAGEAEPCER